MRKHSKYNLGFETLESRSLLSNIFIRHIPNIQVKPEIGIVTGLTLGQTPVLGGQITASLTTGVSGPFALSSVNWSYIIQYQTMVSLPASMSSQAFLSATQIASAPGEYTISVRVTYTSTNPTASPPPSKTFTATTTILPPTDAVKAGGWNVPIPIGTLTSVTDTITSPTGKIGSMVSGTMQEKYDTTINNSTGYTIDGTNGWYTAEAPSFYLSNGMLHDQFGPTSFPNWNNIPNGTAILTFTQNLRYTWVMSGMDNGKLGNEAFTSPCGSLTVSWVKVSNTMWEAQ